MKLKNNLTTIKKNGLEKEVIYVDDLADFVFFYE